jgi:hypothetical protein
MLDDAQPSPAIPEQLPAIPDVYVDTFAFTASAYTVTWDLGLTNPATKQVEPRLIVRMSPQYAKLVAILFRRAVHEYEANMKCEIALPPDLLQQHNMNLETDW